MSDILYLCEHECISKVGICKFSDLITHMSSENIEKCNKIHDNIQCVIVATFPYYNGEEAGNLALYARGKDYHVFLSDVLNSICENMRKLYPQNIFLPFCDASPIPEVYAAYLSSCGILGDNGLLIDETYGSFVFIGTILTDISISPTYENRKTCLHCGKCEKTCPTGALNHSKERCLSELTQKGGQLTKNEENDILNAPYIWGCDICAFCCPLNENIEKTKSEAFTKNIINSLELDDVLHVTRRGFKEKYPDRAFTFRGPSPLIRNIKIKEKT